MVLINGYTISKSDGEEDRPDDFVDSAREAESPVALRPRRHRPLHRRGRDDVTTTSKREHVPTKTTSSSRLKGLAFWKKFRHRNMTATRSKHHAARRYTTTVPVFMDSTVMKRNFGEKNKREITTKFEQDMMNLFDKDFLKSTRYYFTTMKNNAKYLNFTNLYTFDNITTSRLGSTQSPTKDIKTTLQTIAQSKLFSENLISASNATTTDWVGTAELEALLDNIKAHALQILIDENPRVTNLITSSVNEVSFEADPILRHVEVTTPTAHFPMLGASSMFETLLPRAPTDATTHNIDRRSPKEDMYTMAQTLEDFLQSEVKKAYNVLKSKVTHCNELKHIGNIVKSKTAAALETITKATIARKPMARITSASHKTLTPASQTTTHTMPSSQTILTPIKSKSNKTKSLHRVVKATKLTKMKNKVKTTTASTQLSTKEADISSVDDGTLLNLLEQMLVKTNEDNVMRLLSTSYYILPKSNSERVSKRNIETLADLQLKEQVQGSDYEELMPSVGDYSSDSIKESTINQLYNTDITEPISIESISEKISYNDYVNGYKYYLKYQKDQELDDEKFSPLVRYQAHKHHKVDDIGKFILRKLPQVRRERNILDDVDMDDLDISTRTEESWFKKHFYLFLDNTPKKFHTSETVTLKSGQKESVLDIPYNHYSKSTDRSALVANRLDALQQEDTDAGINLDQLARSLEHYKSELSSTTMVSMFKNLWREDNDETTTESAGSGFVIKMMDALLRAKDRKKKKVRHEANNEYYETEPRLRRHAKKSHKHKEIHETSTSGDLHSSAKHKDKFAKMGVVQMIAQPTTVVKIQGKKKSKLKNILKKLHLFRKGDNKSKKAKRQAFRRRRFEPFKRLKELLAGQSRHNLATARQRVVSDYDFVTSDIDTFKAVRFDNIPRIEDMRKQIPNISDDLLPDVKTTITHVRATTPSITESKDEYGEELDNLELDKSNTAEGSDEDNLEVENNRTPESLGEMITDITTRSNTDVVGKMTVAQLENYLSQCHKPVNDISTEVPKDTSETTSPNVLEESISDERKVAKENLQFIAEGASDRSGKKLGPEASAPHRQENLFPDPHRIQSTKPMDFVRNEVERLLKLKMYENSKGVPTAHWTSAATVNDRVVKEMFVPSHLQKSVQRNYVTQRNVQNEVARNRKRHPEPEEIDVESTIELAQFDDADYNDGNYQFIEKKLKPFRRNPGFAAKNMEHANEKKKFFSKYSVRPDYFRDLLMWHGDILNVDSVTTSTFMFEKGFEPLRYTTPDAELLAHEVQDIKRFLNGLQKIGVADNHSTRAIHRSTRERAVAKNSFAEDDKKVDVQFQHELFATTQCSLPTLSIPKNDFINDDDNAFVVLGQAQYLSISKDGDLNIGSQSKELKFSETKIKRNKTLKRKSTAGPLLFHAKREKSDSNWAVLNPRPNVIYSTQPRSRHAVRLWRTHKSRVTTPRKMLSLTPTSKMNRAPKQYFSTPLPMNPHDFEDFLKHSNLDPESVTAPVTDTEVNIRSNEFINKPVVNDEKMDAATSTFPEQASLMYTLKQKQFTSENPSHFIHFTSKSKNGARFRRHGTESDELSHNIVTDKKIKRRKIFGKNDRASMPMADLISEDIVASSSTKEDTGLIEYDTPNTQYLIPKEQSTEEVSQVINTEAKMPKHKTVLYFFIPSNSTTRGTDAQSAGPDKGTIELIKLPASDKLAHRLLKVSNPKRVRISYHYDVQYETKPKTKENASKEDGSEHYGHDSEMEAVAPPLSEPDELSRVNAEAENANYIDIHSRLTRPKAKRHVNNSSGTVAPVLAKRNANPVTYTAHNVGAFEVYLDVTPTTPTPYLVTHEMNALQVHIALPQQSQNVKRQLNSPRPIFRAKMSDAVNLEYQVPVMDDRATSPSDSYIPPGLYMVVDSSAKTGQFTIKPVLSNLAILKARQATGDVTAESKTPKTNIVDDLKRVTLNKDFIAAVNRHLIQLYENFTNTNHKNVKKSPASDSSEEVITKRNRRSIRPYLKQMFVGERTCSCHFKENQTLCPVCVATDAIVEELIFEFNNLANFMKDHCTEIQTFFWINPTGGKKLSDSVHRLDRMLHDYYKRVNNKCQGKTCQSFGGCLTKRTLNNRMRLAKDVGVLPKHLQDIANNVDNALKHLLPFREKLKVNGEHFINVAESCLPGIRNKKFVSSQKQKRLRRSFHRLKPSQPSKHVKIDYKREVTQVNRPVITVSKDQHIIETPTLERDHKYKMDNSLHALTNNMKDLFELLNTMNTTELELSPKKTVKCDKKKCKKLKKKIKKKKKNKNKNKKIKFFNLKKPKKFNNKKTTTSGGELVHPSEENKFGLTTRALRVVLSNVKVEPYVTVDTIAVANNVITKTSPLSTNMCSKCCKQHVNENPTKLPPGETFIFEEGCADKHAFIHKLQKLLHNIVNNNFDKNTGYDTIRYVRTPKYETNYSSLENKIVDITTSPNTFSEDMSSIVEIINATVYSGTNIPISADVEQTEITPTLKDVNGNKNCKTEAIEDVTSIVAKQTFPTIIIIDEATTEAATDDLTIDVMTSVDDNYKISNIKSKDLLLSIIRFEKERLDEEWRRVRDSRQVNEQSSSIVQIQIDQLAGPKRQAVSTDTGKSYASGNYNILSDILHAGKLPGALWKPSKQEVDMTREATMSTAEQIFDNGNPTKTQTTTITKQKVISTEAPTSEMTPKVASAEITAQDVVSKETQTYKCKGKLTPIDTCATSTAQEIIKTIPSTTHEVTQSEDPTTSGAFQEAAPIETQITSNSERKGTPMMDQSSSSTTQEATPLKPQTTHRMTKKVTTDTKRIQDTTAAANGTKSDQKKASDAHRVSRVCDLSATIENILRLQRALSQQDLQQHIRNLTCHKYKTTPRYFVIAKDKMLNSKRRAKQNMRLKWNWIRNERDVNDLNQELNRIDSNTYDGTDVTKRETIDNTLVNFLIEDDFEKFYKGDYGIYKMEDSKRKRRKVDTTTLSKELTSLPPLRPAPNEILVMNGDPVVLPCTGPARDVGIPARNSQWISEPEELIRERNVKVEGTSLLIDHARSSNAGSYICKEGDRVHRRVEVTVLALPTFQIVFAPMYTIPEKTCSYDDLKALRSLSAAMGQLSCPGGDCEVDILEPTCLRDKIDGTVVIAARAVLSLRARAARTVRCAPGGRRDLAARLAGLAAGDVPVLVNVNVLVEGARNKTLVPCARAGSFDVTRRLRRKGVPGKRSRQHVTSPGSVHVTSPGSVHVTSPGSVHVTSPGSVDVTVGCPRRYRLLPTLKICVADARAPSAGKSKSQQPRRPPRRYDWWWYPPCGYCAACACAACACAACATCALLSHRAGDRDVTGDGKSKGRWAEAARRSVSPSRVIIARLFKRSLSAFRHTDSQETRSFPNKVPPPLPPIDFDSS